MLKEERVPVRSKEGNYNKVGDKILKYNAIICKGLLKHMTQ